MAYENTGEQNGKVIEGYFLDDNSLQGTKMPNIPQISPQAIVPNTATINFPYPDDVAPTGGANGDIWYNHEVDELFKKIAGTWTLLTDRVTNSYYIAPVENLTDCPI